MSNEYSVWKKSVENNTTFKKSGDRIISLAEFNSLTTGSRWKIIKDSLILFMLFLAVVLISVYVLYPDNFRDSISTTCAPIVNSTLICESPIVNVTCNNICNITLPDSIFVNTAFDSTNISF